MNLEKSEVMREEMEYLGWTFVMAGENKPHRRCNPCMTCRIMENHEEGSTLSSEFLWRSQVLTAPYSQFCLFLSPPD